MNLEPTRDSPEQHSIYEGQKDEHYLLSKADLHMLQTRIPVNNVNITIKKNIGIPFKRTTEFYLHLEQIGLCQHYEELLQLYPMIKDHFL